MHQGTGPRGVTRLMGGASLQLGSSGGAGDALCCLQLSTGSSDYFVESNLFRSENLENIQIIPDDYGSHAVYVEPSYNFSTSGALSCRGNFPSNYSIIMKFRPVEGRYAFTFLNISTPESVQLSITLDMCQSRLNLTFNQGCLYSPISLAYRPFANLGEWHKLALSIGSGHIAFFVDCELVQLLPLNTENCQVLCNDEATVSILQPSEADHCPTRPVSVSQPSSTFHFEHVTYGALVAIATVTYGAKLLVM